MRGTMFWEDNDMWLWMTGKEILPSEGHDLDLFATISKYVLWIWITFNISKVRKDNESGLLLFNST